MAAVFCGGDLEVSHEHILVTTVKFIAIIAQIIAIVWAIKEVNRKKKK